MENGDRKYVKIQFVGFFEIKSEDLRDSFEADSFEEALENQRKWIKDGKCDFMELASDELPHYITMEFVDNTNDVSVISAEGCQ